VISAPNLKISKDKETITVNFEATKLPTKELVTKIEQTIFEKLEKKVKIRIIPTIVVE